MHPEFTTDEVKKFWERVDTSGGDDACWTWTGAVSRYAYGLLFIRKRYIRAHRVSYALHHGPIPDGYVIAHKCDNPSCVNPKHLWACTQMENIQDRNRKGRQDHGPNAPQWTPPEPRGRIRGERAPRSRLTEEQVREIRRLYKKGVRGHGYSSLAKKFGVHDYAIEMIVKRESWTHIE